MKNMKKGYLFALRVFVLSVLSGVFFHVSAFAMNAKISFNDPTAAAGEEVTVSMRVVSTGGEALGSANIMLNYDTSMLEFVSGDNAEGGAGSLHLTGQATTDKSEWYYGLRFKTLKEGMGSVTVSSAEIYDRDEKIAKIEHQGTSNVTIGRGEAAQEDRKKASLKSLSMTPGRLMPEFSAEQMSYTAIVGDEVTRIAVSAEPVLSDAKISVSGNEDLQLGENNISVQVFSADGSELGTYTILVTKKEGLTPQEGNGSEERTVLIGENRYEIAETFDETLLPYGFHAESYSYRGSQVLSGKGNDENLRLMYLFGEGGIGDLFLYDIASDVWEPYVEVGMSAKSVTALPLGKDVAIPKDLLASRLNLNGKTVDGWIGKEDKGQNFCVFYGMNADGEKHFYRFDLEEKTIQRYFTDAKTEANDGEETLSAEKVDWKGKMTLLLFVWGAIATVLSIVLVFALQKTKTEHEEKTPCVEAETEDEDDDFEEIEL